MKQNWYFFKSGGHFGPFEQKEIVHLFALGKIKERDLLWKEGSDQDWQPLIEYSEFRETLFEADESQKSLNETQYIDPFEEDFQKNQTDQKKLQSSSPSYFHEPIVDSEFDHKAKVEPAPPPPLPDFEDVEDERDDSEDEDSYEENFQEDEIEDWDNLSLKEPRDESEELPPLPSNLEAHDSADDIIEIEHVEGFDWKEKFADFFKDLKTSPRDISWQKFAIFFPFLIGLLFSLFWLTNSSRPYDRFEGLASSDVRALERVYKGQTEQNFAMRASLDGKILWFSHHQQQSGQAYLTLESIKGEVLSEKPIKIKSIGYMREGAALFKEFQIVDGELFSRGRYNYEIEFFKVGTGQRTLEALFSIPYVGDFLKVFWSESEKSKFVGQLSYLGPSKMEFEKDFAQFKEVLNEQVIKSLNDQLQSYETLMSLTLQLEKKVRELYFQTNSVSPQTRREFDRWYARVVAPVVQVIALDTRESYLSLVDQDILKSNIYRDIHNKALEVSEMASEASTVNSSPTQTLESFREKFENFIESWKSEVQAQQTSLQSKLEDAQDKII